MSTIAPYATLATIAAVAVVLVLGLGTLLKGNTANRSQMFMRWRVGLQFIAIILIMLSTYLMKR